MITSHRIPIGLALLFALLLCAFAAQSASAASAKNVTAFACVKAEKAKTGEFNDAHCDSVNAKTEGEYNHVLVAQKNTALEVTNQQTKSSTTESTSAVLKGVLAGIVLEVVCKTVSGEATLSNEEPVAKEHRVKSSITTNFSSCKVEKPAKCTIKEPIVVAGEAEGVEELGAGKNEMGLEVKPAGGGKTFVTLTFEGAECALKEIAFEVQGTAIATGAPEPTAKHSGATAVFTNAMTKETLSIGGKAAEFSASTTVRVRPLPVSLTTFT
jgi:hypothetical protein